MATFDKSVSLKESKDRHEKIQTTLISNNRRFIARYEIYHRENRASLDRGFPKNPFEFKPKVVVDSYTVGTPEHPLLLLETLRQRIENGILQVDLISWEEVSYEDYSAFRRSQENLDMYRILQK